MKPTIEIPQLQPICYRCGQKITDGYCGMDEKGRKHHINPCKGKKE